MRRSSARRESEQRFSQARVADESLRKEVESLLAAHEKDGSFIDSPTYGGAPI